MGHGLSLKEGHGGEGGGKKQREISVVPWEAWCLSSQAVSNWSQPANTYIYQRYHMYKQENVRHVLGDAQRHA